MPTSDGQENPLVDIGSVKLRQQLRQLRRLQSFRNRLKQYRLLLPSGTLPPDLAQEWVAIGKGSGRGKSFKSEFHRGRPVGTLRP